MHLHRGRCHRGGLCRYSHAPPSKITQLPSALTAQLAATLMQASAAQHAGDPGNMHLLHQLVAQLGAQRAAAALATATQQSHVPLANAAALNQGGMDWNAHMQAANQYVVDDTCVCSPTSSSGSRSTSSCCMSCSNSTCNSSRRRLLQRRRRWQTHRPEMTFASRLPTWQTACSCQARATLQLPWCAVEFENTYVLSLRRVQDGEESKQAAVAPESEPPAHAWEAKVC